MREGERKSVCVGGGEGLTTLTCIDVEWRCLAVKMMLCAHRTNWST